MSIMLLIPHSRSLSYVCLPLEPLALSGRARPFSLLPAPVPATFTHVMIATSLSLFLFTLDTHVSGECLLKHPRFFVTHANTDYLLRHTLTSSNPFDARLNRVCNLGTFKE
eukprot:3607034-Karenia_brevis.AAC.1